MADAPTSPLDRVRTIIRVRQMREFTAEPVTTAELEAITEVARWSGSSMNEQPCRFVVIRDQSTIERIAGLGLPQTRGLATAPAAIAIVLPDDAEREVSRAFDDGRAAERILIAATSLGLGAGISSIRPDIRDALSALLALPADRSVHTVVALGHPNEEARRPKSPPGQARLPRDEVIFEERWPTG
jgi:nitroreductase